MALPSGSSMIRLLWLCFISLPLYAENAADHSPLSPHLTNHESIPQTSHALSLRFDYPIMIIDRKDFVGPGAADRLINKFQMADNATNSNWFERIRAAFSGHYEKGFAIKHPDVGSSKLGGGNNPLLHMFNFSGQLLRIRDCEIVSDPGA